MSPRQTAPLYLEHILLALLDDAPMHGYELHHALANTQGISMIWNITQSMLYVMLDKLEEQGLLSSTLLQGTSHPPRKVFSLTEPGRQSLQRWIKTPVRRPRQMRQEFLAKLIVARRYGIPQVLELIQIQQQACQDWLDQLKASFPPGDADHRDAWLVVTYRIQRLEAVIKWLDMCKSELVHENSAA